jgi:transcriptional regulator with XRE-family HTH domain
MATSTTPAPAHVRRSTAPPPIDLRAARVRAGLTQAQLAAVLGCSTTQIARLERGERLPSLPFLVDMAAALGLDELYRSLRPLVGRRVAS